MAGRVKTDEKMKQIDMNRPLRLGTRIMVMKLKGLKAGFH